MITIQISLSLSFLLLQLVLRRSSWFSPRMHFLYACSRLLQCVIVLPSSYSTPLLVFPHSLHSYSSVMAMFVGVIYVSNVSCNISLLLYRSFEFIPVSSGRQISFPLRSPARPLIHLSFVVGVLPAQARRNRKSTTRPRKTNTMSKQVV